MRTGSGLGAATGGSVIAGQQFATPTYAGYEGFLAFDTSAIPAGATVNSATLNVTPASIVATAAWVLEARTLNASPFLPTLDTADWRAGANIAANTTLRASLASSSMAAGTPVNLADTSLAAAIVKAGTTELFLTSDRFRAGTTSAVGEYIVADRSVWVLTVVYTLPFAALAGGIVGHATVTAAITKPAAAFAGPIAGVAALTAALTIPARADLAGTIAGSATVSATGLISGSLTGAIAGSATVTAALSAFAGLAGPIAGSSTSSGALSAFAGLAGPIAGTSTSSGALRLAAGFAATVTARATVTGALRLAAGFAATIAGSATVTGSLSTLPVGPVAVAIEFRGIVHYATGSPAIRPGPWHTLTCDVYGLGWQRGSGEYRGVFTTPDASQADVYLYDATLDLDPTNASGPFYGEIQVGAELRITLAGIVAFWGRLTDISHELKPPPAPGLDPMPVAKLAALDPQGKMADVDLAAQLFLEAEETTSDRIARLLTLADVPGPHSIEAGGRIMAGGAYSKAPDAWSAVVELEQNELGSAEWLPGGILRTHVRETVWPASPPATVLDIGCHGGAIPIYAATPKIARNTIRNEIRPGLTSDTPPYIVWDDPDSQTRYGLRLLTKTDLGFRDTTDRDAWAIAIDAHNAAPSQSWTIELRPNRVDEVTALEAVPLYVGWAHVTIEGYGPLIDRAMRVVGISWTVDADANATAELTLGWDIPDPPLLP